MPIPAPTLDLVVSKLDRYCRKKVPAQQQNRIKVGYRIDGTDVMLYWSRPSREQPIDWIDTVLAKFKFNTRTSDWTLFWADDDNRCHRYSGFAARKNLEDLLREVDDDPTGIFWG